MASQSTKTPEPADSPADASTPPPPAPAAQDSAPFVGEYVGETARTYLFPGGGPQTAERGDVCALPYDPGDGCWTPSKAKVTRLPDNHPDEQAKTSARQAAARTAANENGGEQQ